MVATRPGLVSVVIPTHYRNRRLRSAIESALAQTYDPVEVIVVDDSGTAHAEPVATEYDVTYVAHDENRGGNPARNTGIDRAAGEYVQFLDDDDRLFEEKLERQVTLLRSDEDVGVAYCGLRTSDGVTARPDPTVRGDVLRDALMDRTWPCTNSTMLIERAALEPLLPLTARQAADDVGMKIELAKRTEFDFVGDVLVFHAQLEGSRGQGLPFADEYLRIAREYEGLYDQFPPEVRRTFLGFAHRKRGIALLRNHAWSPQAVLACSRALYYNRSATAFFLAALSLFGNPGYRLAYFVRWRLSGGPDAAGIESGRASP